MLDNLKNKSIILASASPRRSFLLSELLIDHEVKKYDFNEEVPLSTLPEKYAIEISKKKANQIDKKHDHIYITADTTVVNESKVLGKPKSEAEAISILKTLSAKSHKVISGVTISWNDKTISFSESSIVDFAPLSIEEIKFYVDRFKPFDKAGSYGIQEWIGMIGITKISGCYYNIMGLPTRRLYNELKKV